MTTVAKNGAWRVRQASPCDLARLHEINEAAVPGVNAVSIGKLEHLIAQSAATLVACRVDVPAGFALFMSEGLDYDSLNYRWLSERYQKFAYVDRVAVAPEARGQGVGGILYNSAVEHFRGLRPVLLAEVNLAPPNPGSVRFHERSGFERIGERWSDGGKKGVVYLAKDLGHCR